MVLIYLMILTNTCMFTACCLVRLLGVVEIYNFFFFKCFASEFTSFVSIISFSFPSCLHEQALVVHMPSNSMPLPLVSEEKVLFGVIATHPLVKTVKELGKMYNHLDVSTIRKEVSEEEGRRYFFGAGLSPQQ